MITEEQNLIQSRNNGNTLLAAVKKLVRQYNSDMEFIRTKSRWYKQKPYHPIRTRIAILSHWIYWFIVRRK